MVRSSIVALCLFLCLSAHAQKNRYMVFFKNKTGTPFDVNVPSAFLSQKAIERRITHDVSITEQDLPVNPAYVLQVRDAGADVFFQTRWLNGVLIQASEDVVAAVSALEAVDRVELKLRRGPAGAHVESFEVVPAAPAYRATGFSIR